MNRTDLQLLSDARVADAEVLLRDGRWAAAYYLLGYAVECGLKACAARQFQQDEVPDKTVVNDFYTHRLDKLLGISGVKRRWRHGRALSRTSKSIGTLFVTGMRRRGTIIRRRRRRLATCLLRSLIRTAGF